VRAGAKPQFGGNCGKRCVPAAITCTASGARSTDRSFWFGIEISEGPQGIGGAWLADRAAGLWPASGIDHRRKIVTACFGKWARLSGRRLWRL
jgi:hypothetical protein